MRLCSKILYYGLRKRQGRNDLKEAGNLNPALYPACCVVSENPLPSRSFILHTHKAVKPKLLAKA